MELVFKLVLVFIILRLQVVQVVVEILEVLLVLETVEVTHQLRVTLVVPLLMGRRVLLVVVLVDLVETIVVEQAE